MWLDHIAKEKATVAIGPLDSPVLLKDVGILKTQTPCDQVSVRLRVTLLRSNIQNPYSTSSAVRGNFQWEFLALQRAIKAGIFGPGSLLKRRLD